MSYRTVKKAYKRTFGKPKFVRVTTISTVNVEPEHMVYVKSASPVNKERSGGLMKKALYEKKTIAAEDVKELTPEPCQMPPRIYTTREVGDELLLKMLRLRLRKDGYIPKTA